MAKQAEDTQTEDLFPVAPEISAIGITELKLKGGEISGKIQAVANVHDIALLDDKAWQKAAALWLMTLCGGSPHVAMHQLNAAALKFEEAGVGDDVVVHFGRT
jgi:hypothetical protein